MSHSVLRRYTPPTCTLEIIGNQSPLSRWVGQPVLNNLRFHLRLDDPKVPEDQWLSVRGDRAQLDALSEAVTTYVQTFLEQTPTPVTGEAGNRLGTWSSMGAIAVLPDQRIESPSLPATANPTGIMLQPRGLLSHTLTLGTLATTETGEIAHVSTLQLFDLATALDEYQSEIVSLPTSQPKSNWLKSSPAWAKMAAVALVVVGLSGTLMRVFDQSSLQVATTSTPASSRGASSNDQQIATQLPPAATESVKPPVSSNQKLPTPPPAVTKVPSPPPLPTVTVPPTIATAPNTTSSGNAPAQSPGGNAASNQTIALGPTTGMPAGITTAPARSIPAPKVTAPQRLEPEIATLQAPAAAGAAPSELSRRGNASDEAKPSSAFDTIPQVAEVRSYFQQRWNPPQELNQTLDYTLVIGGNGTIRQIIPLTLISGDYVDRTGIPLIGEPFVSALTKGDSARIRLVLSPDGKVQTFLERVE